MSGRLAVGIGSRSGVSAAAVLATIEAALAGRPGEAAGLFTLDRRAAEPGLLAAARRLNLPLTGFPETVLRERSGDALTLSDRSMTAAGVPSVAETAALAGAGAGSRLVVPRMTGPGVTVAVAAPSEEP